MRNRSSTCFLCFLEVPARKILLHHILIQSGHYDDDEDTTEELFEEVLSGYPVVKYKIRLCSLFWIVCTMPLKLRSNLWIVK